MDRDLRQLEREASKGDALAAERLRLARLRSQPPEPVDMTLPVIESVGLIYVVDATRHPITLRSGDFGPCELVARRWGGTPWGPFTVLPGQVLTLKVGFQYFAGGYAYAHAYGPVYRWRIWGQDCGHDVEERVSSILADAVAERDASSSRWRP